MTTPPAPTRPRQVTLAAWLIMGGSVLVVLTVFERMSGLHSLETRQAVEKFLSEPPGDGLGVGVSGVLDALRVFCMVAAGCATAAAILGYQVLQRSRSARIALTVLAAPLFVSGLISGGFVSSVVAASAVMLWFQPARDWFDGVVRESRPATEARPQKPAAVWPPPLPPTASSPTPDQPPTQPSTQPSTQPPAWVGAQPALPLANPAVRPPGVVWACLLTWVFAGLALLVMGLSITMLATSPGLVFDELHRQNPDLAATGVSDATLRSATFVIGGVVAAWSLIAVVVAVLAFRRVRWARAALVVSAAGSVACCLFATLGQFLVVVPLAASVVTLALLVRPEVRAWYDAPGRVRP
ncbi:hypothetical protein [Nocardioides ungokensis]